MEILTALYVLATLGVIYYALATIGATYGVHRYWAHSQGKSIVWFEWVSLTAALFVGVYKPLGWIGIHRLHHKHADTELDPHSPKHQGALNVLLSRWNKPIPLSIIRDVAKNKRIKFFQRHGKKLILPILIISPFTILLGYFGVGILNYFGHLYGTPSNRWFINILAPFEGKHKEHHHGSL